MQRAQRCVAEGRKKKTIDRSLFVATRAKVGEREEREEEDGGMEMVQDAGSRFVACRG